MTLASNFTIILKLISDKPSVNMWIHPMSVDRSLHIINYDTIKSFPEPLWSEISPQAQIPVWSNKSRYVLQQRSVYYLATKSDQTIRPWDTMTHLCSVFRQRLLTWAKPHHWQGPMRWHVWLTALQRLYNGNSSHDNPDSFRPHIFSSHFGICSENVASLCLSRACTSITTWNNESGISQIF